ncbi:MAG: hypothetical protein WCH62_09155, partial [Candidatus Omnitrophota bacterium]
QNSLMKDVYINKNKVVGVNLEDPSVKERIYDRYVQAYKKGAFDYIKEDQTPEGQVVPKKYFSGGIPMAMNLRRDGAKGDVKSEGATIALTVDLRDAAMNSSEDQARAGDRVSFIKKLLNGAFSEQELNDYLPELIKFCIEMSEKERYLFEYGFPAAKSLIASREDLISIGQDLITMRDSQTSSEDKQGYRLFSDGIPGVKEALGENNLKKYWRSLVKLSKASKGPYYRFLKYDLPRLHKNFDVDWSIIFEICELVESDVDSLVGYGFPFAKYLIKNAEDFKVIGKQLAELCRIFGWRAEIAFKDILPFLSDMIQDRKSLQNVGEDVAVLLSGTRNWPHMLKSSLSWTRQSLGDEDFKNYWKELVEVF